MEDKLKGKSDRLKAPKNITKGAKKYFKEIVTNLEESNLLGNGDIYIITTLCKALDRLDNISVMIEYSSNIDDIKSLMRLEDTLSKSLKGYCSELGLSPSSRSRLSSMQQDKELEDADPLLMALKKFNPS
ncbi:phage terminase small subunit P27 family [Clostridium gasigenes]|uniref:phage terminase small subunit P27 family n=1 Tax=Clostridium gasigenes TaxID=94869 RepID=UPI001C0D0393|nr:phage terminase small subunit P27 family [Clostridium gasigenes]MBU3102568.1 phage terminase small subunit P27 family [Clostridium gasigenes]